MTKARSRQKQSRGTSLDARPARSAAARTPARGAPPSWPAIRWLPSIVGLGLGAFGLLGVGSDEPAFMWSMLIAAGVLLAWNAQLLNGPVARARGLVVTVELRRQHYLQVFVQSTIYVYWGWHMPTSMVRDHVPLLLAQLAFAYGFDLLLSWARRGRYTLGFGPFPSSPLDVTLGPRPSSTPRRVQPPCAGPSCAARTPSSPSWKRAGPRICPPA